MNLKPITEQVNVHDPSQFFPDDQQLAVGDRARVSWVVRRGDDKDIAEVVGEVVYLTRMWIVVADDDGTPHRFPLVRSVEAGTYAWPKVQVERG